MSAPKMPEIRQAIEQARSMSGREDTNEFAVEAPRLLARLVAILDLYVGHEPTLAEEAAYKRRAEVLAEITTRLASRATLYGDSTTVNEVINDLTRLAGHARKDTTQPAPSFFRPGRTYTTDNGYRAPELTTVFQVEHITRHPDRGHLRAIGWMRNGAPGAAWHGHFQDEGEFEGWIEITESGDAG